MSEIDFPFYISLPLHFHFLVEMVTFYLYFLCTKLFGRSVSFLLFIEIFVLFSSVHLHHINKSSTYIEQNSFDGLASVVFLEWIKNNNEDVSNKCSF